MENSTHIYQFEGIRWIPGYDDFDYDDYQIIADNEEEAWSKLIKMTRNTWKTVGITSIDGQKVQTNF